MSGITVSQLPVKYRQKTSVIHLDLSWARHLIHSRFNPFLPFLFLLFSLDFPHTHTYLWPEGFHLNAIKRCIFFCILNTCPHLLNFIIDVVHSCHLSDHCMLLSVPIKFYGFFLSSVPQTPLGDFNTFYLFSSFQNNRKAQREQ